MTKINHPIKPNVLKGLYFFAGYPYRDEQEKSFDIHVDGYKWCVWGNRRLDDVRDDAFLFSEDSVFGFTLIKES